MTCQVIIPSAKIVPDRLWGIGKLPGVIYPINQKIIFDYLYDQYEDMCQCMKVICHDKADQVHQCLSRYKSSKLVIEDLPCMGDLGDTVYFAIHNVSEPVIINFADTIVFDNILEAGGDAYFYALERLSDKWTYFEEEKGTITFIQDKVSLRSDKKGKIFVGVFQIVHTQYFSKCLKMASDAADRTEDTFYSALREYSKRYPVKAIKTEKWFDIGHADTYYHSRIRVEAREFNHISIDVNRGMLRKTSEDKAKLVGEIRWYLKLPSDLEYVRPRIFSYSTAYDDPYVEMEYYSYHTIHELFLYGDLDGGQWIRIFEAVKFVCEDFKRYTVKGDNLKTSLEDMYLTKTMERLNRLKQNSHFTAFFNREIHVNGIVYKTLNQIMELLSLSIPALLYDVKMFRIIHGDLCFSNILIDNNHTIIKLIDPRGKFGEYDIYGDFRYELAKLLHSVDGKYDFIIKDMFVVDYDMENAELNYNILDNNLDLNLYGMFMEVFQEELCKDVKKFELIEALLFLSMIPLHGESLDRQVVMLGRGIEILNRVINIEV